MWLFFSRLVSFVCNFRKVCLALQCVMAPHSADLSTSVSRCFQMAAGIYLKVFHSVNISLSFTVNVFFLHKPSVSSAARSLNAALIFQQSWPGRALQREKDGRKISQSWLMSVPLKTYLPSSTRRFSTHRFAWLWKNGVRMEMIPWFFLRGVCVRSSELEDCCAARLVNE